MLFASVLLLSILGADNQTYRTAIGSNSILLSRYVPSTVFQRTWGGSGFDTANGVALDSSGNIYVTGTTYSFCCGTDVFLLKLNSTGGLIWQRIWGGNQTYFYLDSGANALALDSSRNIYVTGYTNYNATGFQGQDAVLLKFDPNGNLLWQTGWQLRKYSYAIGRGISLDDSGAVYLTGTVDFSWIFVLKFSSNGSLLWQKIWGGSGRYTGNGIAVEPSGNIYLAGTAAYYTGSRLTNDSAILLKFNSAGTLEWQKMWGGNNTNMEGASAVSVDSSGNLYVTGFAHDNRNGSSLNGIPITEFNPNGSIAWQRLWLRSGYGSDTIGTGLAVDSSGNIVLIGSASSTGPRNSSIILLEFSANGDPQWQMSAGASSKDYGGGITVDSSGNPIVVGSVMEGPPYTLALLNYPILTSNYTVETLPGGLFNFPSSPLAPINGTSLSAYGSQTYSGQLDAYILKVQPPQPSPPSPPIALAAVAGSDNISLSWNPPEYSGGHPITGYHLFKGTSSGVERYFANASNTRSYVDSEVKTAVIYYYYVKAVNLLGESDASNENHASIGAISGIVIDPVLFIGVSGLVAGLAVLLIYARRRRAPNHHG